MQIDDQLTVLVNQAQQRFVELASVAARKARRGRNTDEAYHDLLRLYSLVLFLESTAEKSYHDLQDAAALINTLGGGQALLYRETVSLEDFSHTGYPFAADDIFYTSPGFLPELDPSCDDSQQNVKTYLDEIIVQLGLLKAQGFKLDMVYHVGIFADHQRPQKPTTGIFAIPDNGWTHDSDSIEPYWICFRQLTDEEWREPLRIRSDGKDGNDGLSIKGDDGLSIKGDKGDDGDLGPPGPVITITNTAFDAAGNLVVYFNNGQSITIPKGTKGDKGDKGDDGNVANFRPEIFVEAGTLDATTVHPTTQGAGVISLQTLTYTNNTGSSRRYKCHSRINLRADDNSDDWELTLVFTYHGVTSWACKTCERVLAWPNNMGKTVDLFHYIQLIPGESVTYQLLGQVTQGGSSQRSTSGYINLTGL
jgi:hypothetical protein